MPRFMVIVKATPDSEAGRMPSELVLRQMTEFNERLVAAGVMVDGNGLRPSSIGAKVKFRPGAAPQVVDGPFTETKELVSGYWILECASLQECVSWVEQVPHDPDTEWELEVRQVTMPEDFGEALTPELQAREDEMRRRNEERHGSRP